MKKYITKRLLVSIATLFVILLVLFILMDLMPGSPFNDEKLTAEQIAALKKYDYREGGVRELLNVVDRALALEISNFDELIREHVAMNAVVDDESEPENLEAAMRRHVRKVFAAHGNNVTQAASALGVSRNTVARYLKGEK